MNQHFLVQYRQIGSDELREVRRPEHIAYRKSLGTDLVLAGPLVGDDGKPVGSVVIIAAPNPIAAERTASDDPFVKAGLLEIGSIQRMRIAAISPPA